MNQNIVVNLSVYNNSWYNPGAGIIKRSLWYITNIVFFMNPINASNRLKVFFLRVFGAKVGKGVVIKPSVNIKYPWRLQIGNYSWIGEKVWIDNLGKVTIGDNCCISQGTLILCGNHNYKSVNFDLMVKDIIIADGCWIGAKCIICPGVICGSHSLLSVGSVAATNLSEYSVYRGNPAEKIRNRDIS